MKEVNENLNEHIKTEEEQGFLERLFEKMLWTTRYVVVLAVIFSVVGAISLFVLGSFEIVASLWTYLPPLLSIGTEIDHSKLLYKLITAVDLYLIGVVLLIFGFGIYELFISKIDIARKDEGVTILEIENLEELKNKIIKVIIMVLIVTFFEKILQLGANDVFEAPKQMLFFALSILALALGVYFVRKHN